MFNEILMVSPGGSVPFWEVALVDHRAWDCGDGEYKFPK